MKPITYDEAHKARYMISSYFELWLRFLNDGSAPRDAWRLTEAAIAWHDLTPKFKTFSSFKQRVLTKLRYERESAKWYMSKRGKLASAQKGGKA